MEKKKILQPIRLKSTEKNYILDYPPVIICKQNLQLIFCTQNFLFIRCKNNKLTQITKVWEVKVLLKHCLN